MNRPANDGLTAGRQRLPADIVAAVVRRGDDVLLVQERPDRTSAPIWMLPGGRVEPGETEAAALRREVREETGLVVQGSFEAAFAVEITAELDDWTGSWRTVTYACSALGELGPDDPDRFVTRAVWVPRRLALERLAVVDWYHPEPLRRHLEGESRPGAEYQYRVSGSRGAAVITGFAERPR